MRVAIIVVLLTTLARSRGYVHSIHARVRPQLRAATRGAQRHVLPRAAEEPDDEGSTDWDAAMRKLRERELQQIQEEREQIRQEREELSRATENDEEEEQAPPQAPAAPAGGGSSFRFESAERAPPKQYTAGLDDRDQKLVSMATVYGGRALTAITLFSLIFYLWVGLSGGITDGFDRFSEPIEDIRVTIEREGAEAF